MLDVLDEVLVVPEVVDAAVRLLQRQGLLQHLILLLIINIIIMIITIITILIINMIIVVPVN